MNDGESIFNLMIFDKQKRLNEGRCLVVKTGDLHGVCAARHDGLHITANFYLAIAGSFPAQANPFPISIAVWRNR
jgi:hypothetical protein